MATTPRSGAVPVVASDLSLGGATYDSGVLLLASALMTFGVAMVYSASMTVRGAELDWHQWWNTPLKQCVFAFGGFLVMLFTAHCDYRWLAWVRKSDVWRAGALYVLAVITLGTPLASAALVLVFRYPLSTALTVAASLGQIGEFSFILAGLGLSLELLPAQGQSLILAGALTSIAINPLMFKAVAPLLRVIRERSAVARSLERRSDPLAELPMSTHEKFLSGQVVLVGYGRVGRRIAEALAERGIPFVVAEQNRELVERLRSQGLAAVCGDASDPAVLIQAHIARASMLVVATANTFNVRQINTTARLLNPSIETVVRTHSEEEAELLEQEQIGTIFFGEGELAKAISRHALERYGKAR